MAKTASSTRSEAATRDRVVEAALRLTAAQGWHAWSLGALAREAALAPDALMRLVRTKACVLNLLEAMIEAKALGGLPVSFVDEGTVRERLFDVIMRRFEALQPHRAAIVAILRALPTMPVVAAGAGLKLQLAMARVLDVAGVPVQGPGGLLKAKALTGAYLWVLRTWLRDEGQDLEATMTALDKALARLEGWASRKRTERAPQAA